MERFASNFAIRLKVPASLTMFNRLTRPFQHSPFLAVAGHGTEKDGHRIRFKHLQTVGHNPKQEP